MMKNEKALTIIGFSILILYTVAVILFVYSFSTEVKVQRVSQLKLVSSLRISSLKVSPVTLEILIKRFIEDTGGLISAIELSYDRSTAVVDLSEKWNMVIDTDKDDVIKKFGRGLSNIYKGSGISSIRRIKFYDQFSASSTDYVQ